MTKSILPIVMSLLAVNAIAETAEQKGLRIAKEADAQNIGFGDTTADMMMTLRNRAGQTSTRKIRSKVLEVRGDGDKSLSLFDSPADVKGTSMLTFSHGLRANDQWLYLPTLKRVKRINSRNKSGPFMGSEFAFEDLGSQEVEQYTYKYLRLEPCGNGWTCHVGERIPAYKYSGYSKQISWMDTKGYRLVKSEFYDRKGSKMKTLVFSGYQQFLGRYWRPGVMNMQNHLTGKSTVLQWSNYKFRTGLSKRDFNKNALSR
ncbi:MAG: outer membrane lipoprotein-sorting protein [Thiotrichaceae bacterium]|nr:outer membrane lipoprotein-sorting protein [Thiotrichaceae bacterium]